MRWFPVLASVALVPASLLGQNVPTHVSPVAAATRVGGYSHDMPFAWVPCTYQQVHALASFSNAQVGLWHQLLLRPVSAPIAPPGQAVDLELFVAESPVDGQGALANFSSNVVSGTEINVIPRQWISLPLVLNGSWPVKLPFTTPFVFTGLAHISWRVNNYGNRNTTAIYTCPMDAWSSWGTYQTPGTGCRSSRGVANAQHWGVVGPPGRTALFIGHSNVAGGGFPAVLAIGNSLTRFAGVPLPFSLTPMGAPGCSLYCNWLTMLTGVAGNNGTGSVQLVVPVPNQPTLVGALLQSQFLFADPAANALGVFTTNAMSALVGEEHGIARIYDNHGPNQQSGILERDFGLAIGFN